MQWPPNLCRVCGQLHEVCTPIFDNRFDATIPIKIKKCFNVTVSKQDTMPKQICKHCLLKLYDLSEFINGFDIANRKFIHLSSKTRLNDNLQDFLNQLLTEEHVPKTSKNLEALNSFGDDCEIPTRDNAGIEPGDRINPGNRGMEIVNSLNDLLKKNIEAIRTKYKLIDGEILRRSN